MLGLSMLCYAMLSEAILVYMERLLESLPNGGCFVVMPSPLMFAVKANRCLVCLCCFVEVGWSLTSGQPEFMHSQFQLPASFLS